MVDDGCLRYSTAVLLLLLVVLVVFLIAYVTADDGCNEGVSDGPVLLLPLPLLALSLAIGPLGGDIRLVAVLLTPETGIDKGRLLLSVVVAVVYDE